MAARMRAERGDGGTRGRHSPGGEFFNLEWALPSKGLKPNRNSGPRQVQEDLLIFEFAVPADAFERRARLEAIAIVGPEFRFDSF